jgi:hypothetical protein
VDAVCVAFKAHMGWLNAVAVMTAADEPRPLFAGKVTLVGDDDREAREPYHVAGGWDGLTKTERPPDPEGVIRRGRKKQARAAVRSLDGLRRDLLDVELDWTRSVMLTTRAWLGHTLDEILCSHAHIHVAEGEATRDAIREALKTLGIPSVDQDEKSIPELAAELLGEDDPDAWMKGRRPPGARHWSREERLTALGAWLHRV